MSTTRSPERTEFLTDILITAVEGGIGYWSLLVSYRYDGDPSERGATVVEEEDYVGEETSRIHVDLDALATAVGKIVRGEVKIAPSLRALIANADRLNTAIPDSGGDIDADAADCIFQVAALDEIVYG